MESEILIERQNTLIRNYDEQKLNKNWRSRKEIVEFNNKFFNQAGTILSEKYKSIFTELTQQADPDNTGGYVSVSYVDDDFSDDSDSLLYNEISDAVNKSLREGFTYGDIAVLCRSNGIATRISEKMISDNIPVFSSESLLISSSSEVEFVISCIELVQDQSNQIAATNILLYLIRKKDTQMNIGIQKAIETILASDDKGITYSQKLTGKANELLNYNHCGYKFFNSENPSLAGLCNKIIRAFGLNVPVNPFITFFQDAVYRYSARKSQNLDEFIDYWENNKNKLSVSVPEQANAVKVMTIHKSKGLEFPVVIFPVAKKNMDHLQQKSLWLSPAEEVFKGLKTTLFPFGKSLLNTELADAYWEENDKNQLDNLNLLYVAMTRPIESLYILIYGKESKSVPDPASTYGLFRKFQTTLSEFSDNEKGFFIGETNRKHMHQRHEPASSWVLNNVFETDWMLKLGISISSSSINDKKFAGSQISRGRIIHQCL